MDLPVAPSTEPDSNELVGELEDFLEIYNNNGEISQQQNQVRNRKKS